MVIKGPESNTIEMLIHSHGTNLHGKGATQRDEEQTKGPNKKKMIVKEETRTISINNNYLPSISGLGHLL